METENLFFRTRDFSKVTSKKTFQTDWVDMNMENEFIKLILLTEFLKTEGKFIPVQKIKNCKTFNGAKKFGKTKLDYRLLI